MSKFNLMDLEFFGRGSIVIMLIFLITEVFGDRLEYNWWFFIGGLIILVWAYIPFIQGEKIRNIKSKRTKSKGGKK